MKNSTETFTPDMKFGSIACPQIYVSNGVVQPRFDIDIDIFVLDTSGDYISEEQLDGWAKESPEGWAGLDLDAHNASIDPNDGYVYARIECFPLEKNPLSGLWKSKRFDRRDVSAYLANLAEATTVVSKAINSAAKELTPCRAALPGGQGDGGCH